MASLSLPGRLHHALPLEGLCSNFPASVREPSPATKILLFKCHLKCPLLCEAFPVALTEAVSFAPLNCICAHLHPYHLSLIPRTQRAEAGFDSPWGTSSISKLAQGWVSRNSGQEREMWAWFSCSLAFPITTLTLSSCPAAHHPLCRAHPGHLLACRLTLAWSGLQLRLTHLCPCSLGLGPGKTRPGERECGGRISSPHQIHVAPPPPRPAFPSLLKTDLFQVINVMVWDLDDIHTCGRNGLQCFSNLGIHMN